MLNVELVAKTSEVVGFEARAIVREHFLGSPNFLKILSSTFATALVDSASRGSKVRKPEK